MPEITLADLLPQMEAQATRMSAKNPARRVLWIAAQILIVQAKEIQAYRDRDTAPDRRIIVPPSAHDMTVSVGAEAAGAIAID